MSRLLLALLLSLSLSGLADEKKPQAVTIAVAANFKHCLQLLIDDFKTTRPTAAFKIVSASTGVLVNQIRHGAPFDILLAADQQRARSLETDFSEQSFIYASGRLVLRVQADMSDSQTADILRNSRGKLAIANPKLAPYGLAAKQSLQHLALWNMLQPRLLRGANIAQTYQYSASGNAELGLVALSQIIHRNDQYYRLIPQSWHQPIHQRGALLNRGRDNDGARRFLAYLRTEQALTIIEQQGYLRPASEPHS